MRAPYVQGVAPAVLDFVHMFWHVDTRDYGEQWTGLARSTMAERRLYDGIRRFILAVVKRGAVAPDEWGEWLNVGTDTNEELGIEAMAFWDWLTDGRPLE